MDVIESEHLVENAANVGSYLLEQLRTIPGPKDVRGRGLMIGMEFDQPIKEIRQRLLFEEHIFTGVSGTNVIRLLPPLCITKQDADRFLESYSKVIKF